MRGSNQGLHRPFGNVQILSLCKFAGLSVVIPYSHRQSLEVAVPVDIVLSNLRPGRCSEGAASGEDQLLYHDRRVSSKLRVL